MKASSPKKKLPDNSGSFLCCMPDGKNAGKNRKTPRGRMEKPRGEEDGTPTQGKTEKT